MINSLTNGLGAELGKKVRISFYNKERILKQHDSFHNFTSNQKDLFVDLLALSIFHDFAIGPLHGSINFMNYTKKYGVKSIGMGSYKFDEKMKKISQGITKGFFEILKKYNIEIYQLNIGSIAEFIKTNKKFVIENIQ